MRHLLIAPQKRYKGVTIPSGAQGIWSVFRVNNWPGKAFEATRASDGAAIDIGFTAEGLADFDRMDSFGRGTSITITKIYDQSGNGFDLTGTAPKQFGNKVNGIRSITFNSGATNESMSNTSLPISEVRNTTCIWAGQPGAGQSSGVLFQIGIPFKFYVGTSTGAGMVDNNTLSKCLTTSPCVITRTGNGASNRTTTMNDISFSMTANTSSSTTGVVLGNGVGDSSPGRSEFLFLAVYNSTIAAANLAWVKDSVHGVTGIGRSSAIDTFVIAGDSIARGTIESTASYRNTWPQLLSSQLGRPLAFYHLGVSGQTASGGAASAATLAGRSFSSGKFNAVSISWGTNDLAANATAAATYSNLQTIAAAYRSAGFNKILMSTILPRKASFSGGQTSGGFETARLDLNTLIRAGEGIDFDKLIDIGADAVIGNEANCTATYYSDLVHLSTLGNSLAAPHFVNAALTVL